MELDKEQMLKLKQIAPFELIDGYIIVSKEDMKDIFGTLMDFDLDRIVEEAEDSDPEAIAKYRALENILYER